MIKFMNKLFFPFSSDKYNLETKWWHRLLKILYFLVSIIILILSFFIIKEWFWNNLENKMSLYEFWNLVKDKYPEYKNFDNITIANKVIEKYPIYKNRISYNNNDSFLFYSEITILTILSYLIINFIIQLFYYKWILYIVYGNNKS